CCTIVGECFPSLIDGWPPLRRYIKIDPKRLLDSLLASVTNLDLDVYHFAHCRMLRMYSNNISAHVCIKYNRCLGRYSWCRSRHNRCLDRYSWCRSRL